MTKERILEILEGAKDKTGSVPMSLVRKAFENIPNESHWIPCSESLPEDDDVEVLCTVKQQSKTDHSETIIVEQGCYFYGTWLLSYDNQRVNCTREVIAWQPLPSPYQPEEESE